MIIGLVGRANSGKSTVSKAIRVMRPVTYEQSLASPIKDALRAIFGRAPEHQQGLFGPSEARSKQIGDFTLADGSPLTYRTAAQTLGTQWGRNTINPNLWIQLGLKRAKDKHDTGATHVVIPDCRFNNEFKAIRAAGGELWHIVRPGAPMKGSTTEQEHESERDMLPVDAPYWPLADLRTAVITNDDTLEHLFDQVRVLVDRL